MLLLKPTCEHCNKKLPPNSLEAMICSFECTFCVDCVNDFIGNVCPNCGGNLVPRPIRPSTNLKNDSYLGEYPASTDVIYKPKDKAEHLIFKIAIEAIAPQDR